MMTLCVSKEIKGRLRFYYKNSNYLSCQIRANLLTLIYKLK